MLNLYLCIFLNDNFSADCVLLKSRGKCQLRVSVVYLQHSFNCCKEEELPEPYNGRKQLVVALEHLWPWQTLTDRSPAPFMTLLWASENSLMEWYSVPSLHASLWKLWLNFFLSMGGYFNYFLLLWDCCSLVTVHLFAFHWLFFFSKLVLAFWEEEAG